MKIFNFSNHHSISDLLSHIDLLVFTHAITVVIALLQNEKGRIPEVNHFTPVDTSCYLFIFTPQTCYPPSYTIPPLPFLWTQLPKPLFSIPLLHITSSCYWCGVLAVTCVEYLPFAAALRFYNKCDTVQI